jgi:hypothetical protein
MKSHDITLAETHPSKGKDECVGFICPDCNGPLIPEGGCWFCPACGFSTC